MPEFNRQYHMKTQETLCWNLIDDTALRIEITHRNLIDNVNQKATTMKI